MRYLFPFVLFIPSIVYADGLIYSLPPDGSWAKFKVYQHDGTLSLWTALHRSRKSWSCKALWFCVPWGRNDGTGMSVAGSNSKRLARPPRSIPTFPDESSS